jgi:hypothetical protein
MQNAVRSLGVAASVLMFWATACAQGEWEHDLVVVPQPRPEAAVERGGGLIALPFFDDFSTPSFADAPAWVPDELIRWEASSAAITQTYALAAPTIGVATFNGCDRLGYPYSWTNSNVVGWADTLTSLPINLNGYSTSSDVHLVFSFERGGRGNAADVGEDSLIVEFKATDINGDAVWTQVWSTDSCGVDEFTRAFIPVNEQIWLQAGFQFRFRNYGSLSGNVDLWHVDYVFVDDGIDPETYQVISEVAFTEPMNTLLRDYTRMPWTHYVENPSLFMRDSVTSFHRNYSDGQADNIAGGFNVEHEGNVQGYPNAFSTTFVAAGEEFTTGYYVGLPPANFAFNPTVSDTAASFEVTFYESSVGLLHQQKVGVLDNDSIGFTQVFANDYAYDDGSAERAYALTAAAGKLAVRYPLAQADTLLGLAIHFTPYYTDASEETFLLRVWSDDAGMPGEELGTNYQFHSPSYYSQGPDVFGYFPLDDPLPVEGVIHVGLVQSTDAMLNFGLDKNTNANVGNVHYTLGLGSPWQVSEIEGSVMIRPVFRAGIEQEWVDVAEVPQVEPLSVYPNPASDVLRIEGPQRVAWQAFSLTGQLLDQGVSDGAGVVVRSVSDWPNGMVVVRFATGEVAKCWVQH